MTAMRLIKSNLHFANKKSELFIMCVCVSEGEKKFHQKSSRQSRQFVHILNASSIHLCEVSNETSLEIKLSIMFANVFNS